VRGVEIGVARYFNGTDWIGPIELNIEHKKLFPGDLGPKTCEMGTLLWYTADENNRLFCEMLAPLKPYLQKINFRGDFDINCIVNEQGAWPLEATARFGYPAVQAQMALHETPWGKFLKAVADGKPCDLCWRSGYAVVVLIAVPPFPFCTKPCDCALNPNGLKIRFRESLCPDELAHYHFEEALRHPDGEWEICHDSGYVLHVTGHGATVEAAREAVNRRAANVVIPRMFYRMDIGRNFLREDRKRLERLGYL
jgi:phosphoribosylamine--glycine ligase